MRGSPCSAISTSGSRTLQLPRGFPDWAAVAPTVSENQYQEKDDENEGSKPDIHFQLLSLAN